MSEDQLEALAKASVSHSAMIGVLVETVNDLVQFIDDLDLMASYEARLSIVLAERKGEI